MSVIDFQSASEIKRNRDLEREAREEILAKAKRKYEKEQQREKEAEERGETTWMLPSLEKKLKSGKKKNKKEKKKKKKKKEKKTKKKKKSTSSSSSSSEEDETPNTSENWVEKTSQPSEEPVKRDEWMQLTSLFKTQTREQMKISDGSSRALKKLEERKMKETKNKPGTHPRELNPFYKDGGTGLPSSQSSAAPAAPSIATPKTSTSSYDASWLQRALQRAKNQAAEEGRSLEDVAKERWGSLDTFYKLLKDAEEGAREKGNQEERKGGEKKSDNKDEKLRERSRERSNKVIDEKRKRDREKTEGRDYKSRRYSRSRSRDRSSRDRNRNRSGSREKNRYSRSRSRDRERKSRSREGDRICKNRNSRSRSRDMGKRSRSRDRDRGKRSRSRDTDRNRRSRSRDSVKSSRSSSRDKRDKDRSRSDKRDKRRSSSSSSSSESSSDERRSNRRPHTTSHSRYSNRIGQSSNDRPSRGFLKPGEDSETREIQTTLRLGATNTNSGGGSWRKKTSTQQFQAPSQSSSATRSSSSSESSSESEDEKVTTQPQEEVKEVKPTPTSSTVFVLTEKEMNQLAAKLTKAELMGNDAQVAKLKSKLEAARKAREEQAKSVPEGGPEEATEENEMVLLTRTDKRGFTRPVAEAPGADEGKVKGRKKKRKVEVFDADGKRTSYFADDFKVDLQTMFEREKLTTAADEIAALEKLSCANVEKLSDDFDVDDMYVAKVAPKESSVTEKERDRLKAIWEHQRMQKTLDSCHFCFGNKLMKKHLIIALGTKCYLSLPPHQSLTEGHCFIVPVHHVPCSTQADEDLWEEITSFRQALVRAFSANDMDCVFFETATRLEHTPHMVLQCVPLPRETGELAPIYFKKAILECDEEWAQNKKLIELKGRNVRQAVPKELPYFFVDFGMMPGFAHVVENERLFPNNFAQEIIGGMIDSEVSLFRKPKMENFDVQRKKVLKFAEFFKPFDPTE